MRSQKSPYIFTQDMRRKSPPMRDAFAMQIVEKFQRRKSLEIEPNDEDFIERASDLNIVNETEEENKKNVISLRDLSKSLKKFNTYKVDLLDYLNPDRNKVMMVSQPFQKEDNIEESDSEDDHSDNMVKCEEVFEDKLEPIESAKIDKKSIRKIDKEDVIEEEKEEN